MPTTKEVLDTATLFFEDLLITISKGEFCLDRSLFPPETRDITETVAEINTLVTDAFGDDPENLMAALMAKKQIIDDALDTVGS